MEFSRQEYWGGLTFPSPGGLPQPGTEPGSPACRQILYRLSHQGSTHATGIGKCWRPGAFLLKSQLLNSFWHSPTLKEGGWEQRDGSRARGNLWIYSFHLMLTPGLQFVKTVDSPRVELLHS